MIYPIAFYGCKWIEAYQNNQLVAAYLSGEKYIDIFEKLSFVTTTGTTAGGATAFLLKSVNWPVKAFKRNTRSHGTMP